MANLLPPSAPVPDFTLLDHLDRRFRLRDVLGQGHGVLLAFYPRDWTPVCGVEIPRLNAMAPAFRALGIAPVAISVDSRHSHAQWCASRGGIQIPVLADAHPHGQVARAYGAWDRLEDAAAPATFLIRPDGRVFGRDLAAGHAPRDLEKILALARKFAAAMRMAPIPPPVPPAGDAGADAGPYVLFASRGCVHCLAVLAAMRNLGCTSRQVEVRFVETSQVARELRELTHQAHVPALVGGGKLRVGSGSILPFLRDTLCVAPAGAAETQPVLYLSRGAHASADLAVALADADLIERVRLKCVDSEPDARAELDVVAPGHAPPVLLLTDGRIVVGAAEIMRALEGA